MAEGFAYGNARLRAMRSRLLKGADYEELLSKIGIEAVIAGLSEMRPYKADVETALGRYEGVECVSEALSANLLRTLRQVRGFFEGKPQALLDLLLRRWDRHNVLAIVRGQSQQVPAERMLAGVVPAGSLDLVALREMARQPGLRAAIDLMITWGLPYAGALRRVRARAGNVPDLEQLELALNREHYGGLREALSGGTGQQAEVLESIQTEIDLTNLRTALRLARVHEIAPVLRQRYGTAGAQALFIEPGGYVTVLHLVQAIAGGIGGLIQALSDTRYGAPLRAGWARYQKKDGGLPVFERELERWEARRLMGLFSQDPLGIGIAIGYIGCKEVEIENLRLVAQAVHLNMGRDQVRRELIVV